MRTHPDQKQLQEWLIEIGEGKHEETARRGQNGYFVPIPDQIVSDELEDVTNFCFPPAMFCNPFQYADSIAHNAILCPRNNEVDEINKAAMSRMAGEEKEFKSIDEPLGNVDPLDAYRADSTLEAVHNECPSGFPPHKLFLKVYHLLYNHYLYVSVTIIVLLGWSTRDATTKPGRIYRPLQRNANADRKNDRPQPLLSHTHWPTR